MSMPPPLEPESDEKEDRDGPPRINLNGLVDRINKLGISDYIFALGAGLRAFHEVRKRRQDHDVDEK